jgi:hypothetical protein
MRKENINDIDYPIWGNYKKKLSAITNTPKAMEYRSDINSTVDIPEVVGYTPARTEFQSYT